MGADDGHGGRLAGAHRGVELIGEVAEAETASALRAVEGVLELAALEPAEGVAIAEAHATDVFVVAGNIVVLCPARGAGADSVVAFENVGVVLADGAGTVLAGVPGRAATTPKASPKGAAFLGHKVTVPGCATAGHRGPCTPVYAPNGLVYRSPR